MSDSDSTEDEEFVYLEIDDNCDKDDDDDDSEAEQILDDVIEYSQIRAANKSAADVTTTTIIGNSTTNFDGGGSSNEHKDYHDDDEADDDDNEDDDIESPVNQAKSLILQSQEITAENALRLNQQMQQNLRQFKSQLEQMLKQLVTKYESNELIIENLRNGSNQSSTTNNTNEIERFELKKRSNSYYFCGAPFFKTSSYASAPSNRDYLYRKNQLKELFPLDLNDQITYWLAKDKMFLIQGAKRQVIEFLRVKNKDSIRELKRKGTRASTKTSEILSETIYDMEKKRLVDLFKKLNEIDVAKKFRFDWFSISAMDLDGRHEPNECEAMWNGYLNPELNRSCWTEDEDHLLIDAVILYNQQDWQSIAEMIPGRSAFQCFVHYQSVLNQNVIKNIKWTPEEDNLLLDWVDKLRIGDIIPWSNVTEKMPGRNRVQVYNRYTCTICPGIRRSRFTTEEDCIIMAAFNEHGLNFHLYPMHLLPGRTLLQIRNRYNNCLRLVGQRSHWNEETDEKLMKLVEKYGESNWSKIAEELQSQTRQSCRSRYFVIQRFLNKNPLLSLKDVPRKKKPVSTVVTKTNWIETLIQLKTDDSEEMNNDEDNTTDYLNSNQKYLVTPILTKTRKNLFNYLKYSYNFQLSHFCDPDLFTTDRTRFLCQILSNHLCPQDFKMFSISTLTLQLIDWPSEMNELNISLPLNWCSALTLRGLSIMFNCQSVNLWLSAIKNQQIEKRNHDSLKLFKQRFISILFNTAIMTKFDLDGEAIHFFNRPIINKSSLTQETKPTSSSSSFSPSSSQTYQNHYTIETNNGEFQISLLDLASSDKNENIQIEYVIEEVEEEEEEDESSLPPQNNQPASQQLPNSDRKRLLIENNKELPSKRKKNVI